MEDINSQIDQDERYYLGSSIAEKKPDVAFLLTPRSYAKPPDNYYSHKSGLITVSPIEKLIKHYEELDTSYTEEYAWDLPHRQANLRSIIKRVLQGLSSEELEKLFSAGLDGESRTVKGALAQNGLLPEVHQLLSKLWQVDVTFDVGALSVIPLEVTRELIFKRFTINEARRVAAVSKSWFKVLTSREVWHEESKSSNPYLALLKKEFYAKYMKRSVIHTEDVEVVNGEGLLVFEEGFVQGVKLNGKNLIAAWNDNEGSVGRCMVYSRVLTREEINIIVNRIESTMNEGDLDLSVLIERLKPFMQCLMSGGYRVQVSREDHLGVVQFRSTDDLSNLLGTYPVTQTIYCTQPVDLLDKKRVAYYEDLITKGKRPAMLLFVAESDLFLIDGHHKLEAYKNLNLLAEATLIQILPTVVRITPEVERTYINHSPDALEQYNRSSQYHYNH
eukprot:TRINITY_DN7734_c0_g1_i1.p1 TRINITY_DN7734_c0_g1~~TRINITY_DN7734_c0_g1_i1.p1  ORF type:complete len:446 (-),score=79.77 TRINITY_DN7734_c0_g1_i1:32-1369(-)